MTICIFLVDVHPSLPTPTLVCSIPVKSLLFSPIHLLMDLLEVMDKFGDEMRCPDIAGKYLNLTSF